MPMNHKIFIIIFLLLNAISMRGNATTDSVAEKLSALAPEWNSVLITGKLRMTGLPFSPSMKMYMQRGKFLSIVLSAPLYGEVGRIELTPDRFLAINKMDNIYCEENNILPESISNILAIDNIQQLLLGHPTSPGAKTFSLQENTETGCSQEDNEEYAISRYYITGHAILLLYIMAPDGSLSRQCISGDSVFGEDWSLMFTYNENKQGTKIEFNSNHINDIPPLTLEYSKISWEGEAILPATISAKMKRVNISSFIRSF